MRPLCFCARCGARAAGPGASPTPSRVGGDARAARARGAARRERGAGRARGETQRRAAGIDIDIERPFDMPLLERKGCRAIILIQYTPRMSTVSVGIAYAVPDR